MVEISFDKVVGHLFIDSVSFVTHEVGAELVAPWWNVHEKHFLVSVAFKVFFFAARIEILCL